MPRYALIALLAFTACAQTTEPPKSWIDPGTGHRLIRLTSEPNSAGLYFNQNAYTAGMKRMVFTTPNGISIFDFDSRTSKQIVTGRTRLIEAGRRTQNVYYIRNGSVWSTDADSGIAREIGKLPPRGSVVTINADETLLAGTYTEEEPPQASSSGQQQGHPLDQPANKGQMMEQRLAARIPLGLFMMDVKTGQTKTILKSTDWVNHLLFSPTDPALLMYCHEGPWHKVDRIWTIRTDGTENKLMHHRTMAMEIAGHEFWSADGSTIWYDLQTPRGEDFWLAGVNVKTAARTWYHLQRNEWSIHFNVTQDGTLFCGDGGDERQVARAKDGQWIYLFRPRKIENKGVDSKSLITPGVLESERLVDMSKHNYRLEPNVRFSPDKKWVIFRSNMFGPTYTFAVEVAKASESTTK